MGVTTPRSLHVGAEATGLPLHVLGSYSENLVTRPWESPSHVKSSTRLWNHLGKWTPHIPLEPRKMSPCGAETSLPIQHCSNYSFMSKINNRGCFNSLSLFFLGGGFILQWYIRQPSRHCQFLKTQFIPISPELPVARCSPVYRKHQALFRVCLKHSSPCSWPSWSHLLLQI